MPERRAAADLVAYGRVFTLIDTVGAAHGEPDAVRRRIALRADYVWKGAVAETVPLCAPAAPDLLVTPGRYLVYAGAPVTPDSCRVPLRDGVVTEDDAAWDFYRLGAPRWRRPGQPWLDLTPDDLLTIARNRDDWRAGARALDELARSAPPNLASRLSGVWYVGPYAMRRSLLAYAEARRGVMDPEIALALHRTALDGCADAEPAARALAVRLLGAAGVRTTTTFRVLERLRDRDPDATVRTAAERALWELGE